MAIPETEIYKYLESLSNEEFLVFDRNLQSRQPTIAKTCRKKTASAKEIGTFVAHLKIQDMLLGKA